MEKRKTAEVFNVKKPIMLLLCLVLALSFAACGSSAEKKEGDTTVKIDGIVYYNTRQTVSFRPDEADIVYAELPLNGSLSNAKISAYAFVREENSEDTLTCLIGGAWYRFEETDRA